VRRFRRQVDLHLMAKVTQLKATHMKLSPNFYLAELTVSETAERKGIDNTPDTFALANLFKTAALLEQVRVLLGGKSVLVSSGYRGPKLNALVGGSTDSDHMRGEAADFRCPSYGSPLDICRVIAASGIEFGQLIWEGSWVHISLPNRLVNRDVRTAVFKAGKKTTYPKGLPA
jgi:hypothetical protein